MVIQHNIPALNSHRSLGVNNRAASKNLEKLSSGFRINRAGDDAAGLAISEKMRGQIRGLGKAEENTSNAINLIQTAEGGMQELHSIVQRMREISVQSTNGTYHNQVDREGLNAEFQALKEEFDRIADYTNYNGIKLLNGDPFKSSTANSAGNTFSIDSTAAGAAGTLWRQISGGTALTASAVTGLDEIDWADYEVTFDLKFDDEGELDLASSTVTFNDLAGGTYQGELSLSGGNLLVTLTNPNDSTQTGSLQVNTSALDVNAGVTGASFSQMVTTTGGTTAYAAALTDLSITYTDEVAAQIHAYKNAQADQIADGADESWKLLTSMAGTAISGTATGTSGYDQKFDYAIELIYDADGTFNQTKTNALLKNLYDIGAIDYQVAFTVTAGAGTIAMAITGDNGVDVTMTLTGAGAALPDVPEGTASVTVAFSLVNDDSATAGTWATRVEDTAFYVNTTTTGDLASKNIKGNDSSDTLIFQVGANGTKDQQVYLKLHDMHAEMLGMGADFSELRDEITAFEKADGTSIDRSSFSKLTVADLNVSNVDNANVSIEVLTQALNDVSLKRAELGAVQNRLEYTLNNLGVTKENLTAAESTIRDVDMAKEMMEFTKNSILIQSSQAMLAQANTLPQGVLQLLR